MDGEQETAPFDPSSRPEREDAATSTRSSRPEREARSGETPVVQDASETKAHSEEQSTPQPAQPTDAFTLESPKPAPIPEPRKPTTKKEPEEASQSPFSVTVGKVYDGPLDLLLDLIRKQNIDIYDIPISRITAQFLEYTHHLKQVDVDAAGEFVYVASLLIHIKSKTLLPRDPTELGDNGAAEDPRRELVERLLEHERFKAAAQMLLQKQQIEEATWSQPGLKAFLREQGQDSVEGEREIDATTIDIVRVFQDVMQRLRERPVHTINEDSVTVAQMIDFVKRRLLMEDRPISLRRMLSTTRSERALICTFLAMLELVRLQAILLRQPEEQGDILVKKAENFDQVMADQAQVRDDWD